MMAQLIKNQNVAPQGDFFQGAVDTWKTLEIAEGETPETVALPAGDIIFPFAVWQVRKTEIISCHKRIGLLLQPEDRVEDIAGDLDYFIVIAINFPKFVDGRGYSSATLLRQRYHYEGELRAVGDVLHDQLFFMRRVGFDAYALKEGKNLVYALAAGFTPFSDSYQTSTSQPQPHFRRRA
jgi:uncharacterized protein (DUF934 family)